VTKAADLIAALLPRKAAPMLERHTGLPYGWGIWMRGLPARLGTITREKAEDVVALLAQRPLPKPDPVAPALNRLQALRALFYQDWDPPLREERGIRWLAGFVSLVMHLLFFVLLVLAALVNVPLPPPAGADSSSRVQVEFIGRGTPEQQGGGPPAEQAAPAQSAAATTSAAAAASSTPALPPLAVGEPAAPALSSEVPELQQRQVPEPSPPAAPQTLQVTETPVPTIEFVLPPPTPPTLEVAPPQIRTPELGVPTREVTVVPAPPAQPELPRRPVEAPQVVAPEQQIQQREIAAPAPQVRQLQLPSPAVRTPELRAPAVSVREAEVPAPQPRPSPAGTAAAPAAAPGSAAAQTAAATPPQGAQSNAASSAPGAADRPGGRPAPTRADDWGDSNRNLPGETGASGRGQRPGLFNSDGSVRLPGAGDAATGGDSGGSRGAPGGEQDAWTRERLEQAGTWLQRPPYDYEPTAFDKFWVPNESLLQEWVRKNIRETSIPIPGTTKRLKCVVSILQLGGGCGIVDPNLNEQPAEARPPPDIPVKRTPIPTDS
jgi:hypothetical protein